MQLGEIYNRRLSTDILFTQHHEPTKNANFSKFDVQMSHNISIISLRPSLEKLLSNMTYADDAILTR